MKLLVIGTGLFGRNLVEKAFSSYQVFATYNKNFPQTDDAKLLNLDITDEENCKRIIEKIKPDFVVLTAALTNVDLCEKEKRIAYKINVDGAKNVCLAAKKVDSKMVYISTDYVFDGKKGNYKEGDETNPIDYYGYTKLLGEEIIKNNVDDWVIARTSVLYGLNPVKLNFVTWVIIQLKEKKMVKAVTDQYTSPTFVGNLSEMILELIKRKKNGVFHTSGREKINRYEFALKIADIFGFEKNLIKAIKTSELNWVAERPKDSSLNIKKISKIVRPLTIQEGLKAIKGELI